MATTKAKTTGKSTAKKTRTKSTKSAASKPAKTTRVATIISKAKPSPIREFFARKYDASENILTIFQSPKIIGAILGEIVGTMLLSMILLTLGMNPLYLIFGVMVITIAVFALSGANINPLVTVGMMASRRMSPIRGTLYIIAQLLGAWCGMLAVNAFRLAGGEAASPLPTLDVPLWGEGQMFWPMAMIEAMGAIIIGFCFARALVYKRSVFTFGAVVAGGVFVAVLLAAVLVGSYVLPQQNTTGFVMNPAVAIMFQALPSDAATFGELLGQMGIAISAYVALPMVGGVIGFYLSDLATKMSGQKFSE